MSKTDAAQYISWRQLAPIFADVVVSPWNLLVGGLLIQSLSTWQALVSIIIGYAILAAVFILYGGLGFKKRKQSSDILHEVFGNTFSTYVIPVALALGQVGWAAIIISLGGTSLASLTHIPVWVGIALYTALLGVMTSMNFFKLAIIKTAILVSSFSLIGYAVCAKLFIVAPSVSLAHQPASNHSLFWGVSNVIANTDGSIALYTPALKIISLRTMPLGAATTIAALVTLACALSGLAGHLAAWLSILSLMTPIFIGVAFAAILFNEISTATFKALERKATLWVYGITTALCAACALVMQSVLIGLVAPLILYAGYLQYRIMCE